jgi:hypothetical protein
LSGGLFGTDDIADGFTCLGIDAHEILVSAVTLDDCKRFYAEEIRFSANVRSPSLVAAFERVPREKFLGPGPWRIASADLGLGGVAYTTTDSADPHHVYHNVPIALDTSRDLNNGQPGTLARWIDAIDLKLGDRVFHVGCGVVRRAAYKDFRLFERWRSSSGASSSMF